MEIVQEKNKRTGLIVSIVIHTILLILFAIYGLTYLDPPPEAEGITINFGNTDMGRMTDNNENPEDKQEVIPIETQVEEPVPTENTEEEVLTQETEEAPALDKKEEKKEKQEKVPEKPVEEVKKPDQRTTEALDKWKKNQTDASGGDGTTDQSGDQGSQDGDKNSTNYKGGGQGSGTSFSLSGRSMITPPKINDQSQEVGKVVVEIIVDRYGKVIRATPGERGSTTTSRLLYDKAKQAALQTKFNPNPDAAEEQKGQMTFIFELN